jgi:hypothetical protein
MMGTVIGGTAMAGSLGMATGPLAGGFIYDSFATYTWLYVGAWAMGIGAFPDRPDLQAFSQGARVGGGLARWNVKTARDVEDVRTAMARPCLHYDPDFPGRDDWPPALELGSSLSTASVAAPAKAPTAASVTSCVASESRDEADLIFFLARPLCPARTAAAAAAPAISAAATAWRTSGEVKELVIQSIVCRFADAAFALLFLGARLLD